MSCKNCGLDFYEYYKVRIVNGCYVSSLYNVTERMIAEDPIRRISVSLNGRSVYVDGREIHKHITECRSSANEN